MPADWYDRQDVDHDLGKCTALALIEDRAFQAPVDPTREGYSMAKMSPDSSGNEKALQSGDVPDEVVTQVGKAAIQIVKLRQVMEQNMASAQSDDERQTLAEQVEVAAVRAIGEQGLTVAEYNQVISAAQSDSDLEERVLDACRSA